MIDFQGWPYLFIVTVADVLSGQELLIDYSLSYVQHVCTHTQELLIDYSLSHVCTFARPHNRTFYPTQFVYAMHMVVARDGTPHTQPFAAGSCSPFLLLFFDPLCVAVPCLLCIVCCNQVLGGAHAGEQSNAVHQLGQGRSASGKLHVIRTFLFLVFCCT